MIAVSHPPFGEKCKLHAPFVSSTMEASEDDPESEPPVAPASGTWPRSTAIVEFGEDWHPMMRATRGRR
jgi:hypothetical protein